MKKNDFWKILELLLGPGLLVLLGLVLVFSPDTATALITKLIAWALILTGAVQGFSGVFGSARRIGRIIGAAVILLVGLWLLSDPLVLAKWLGRILGFFILLQGVQNIALGKGRFSIVPAVTTVIGLILLIVPMTTSRLIFIILGIIVLAVGVTELLSRLRALQKPEDDDGIIDV